MFGKYINIFFCWIIVTFFYTIWSLFSYPEPASLAFHISGGLFVAGLVLAMVGVFSHMGASGVFDGISYGFKRSRRQQLKEIDPDYEEDEIDHDDLQIERTVRKKRSWVWMYSGFISVLLSYGLAFFL